MSLYALLKEDLECEGGQSRLRLLCCLLRENSEPRLVLLQEPKEAGTAEPSFPQRRKVLPRQQHRHLITTRQ